MSLTQADMEAVSALVKAGRIDEARSLLSSVDDDRARAALVKFNTRYPVTAKPKAKINVDDIPEGSPVRILYYLLCLLVITAGAAVIYILIGTPVLQYINRIDLRMNEICRYRVVYATGAQYTNDQINEGCENAVLVTKNVYDKEIHYCFDEYNQTDKRFSDCLIEQDVYLDGETHIKLFQPNR